MWNLLVGTNKHVSSEENGGVLLKHNQNTQRMGERQLHREKACII